MKSLASSQRLVLVATLTLAAFGAVAARLYHLHVHRHAVSVETVERMRRKVDLLEARRGDVLDAGLTSLATSKSVIEVGLDPEVARVLTPDQRAALAATLGLETAVVEAALARSAGPEEVRAEADAGPEGEPGALAPARTRWVRLVPEVEETTWRAVQDLRLPGVTGDRRWRRFYPGGQLAAHVVGFINRDHAAVTGVERTMDFYLRGQQGWRESERDGRRRELAQFRTREVPAADGLHVVLSIDGVIQNAAENQLAALQREFNPRRASILVSEARTGFLLALANYPTFDLNRYGRATETELRNTAIADLIDPGSTFKIVPIGGALDQGLLRPEDRLDCSLASMVVEGTAVRPPRESHPFHAPASLVEITARSSNVGSAQIGVLLGRQRLTDYARAFGFGARTGLALPGEEGGILLEASELRPIDLTRLAIGHVTSATALQIHQAMGVVAQGGVLLRPQLVRAVVDARRDPVLAYSPVAVRRVLSPSANRTLARLLTEVVESDQGTGRAAVLPGYPIAGKTGTSQKLIGGFYSTQHHVATFSGFFPAHDPQFVVTVVVDEAQVAGTAYASRVAVPHFREVCLRIIQHFGLPPLPAAAGSGPTLARR